MLFQPSDIEPPIAFNVPRNFDRSCTCTSGAGLAGFFTDIHVPRGSPVFAKNGHTQYAVSVLQLFQS
jgi:hypothetical protein